MAKDALGHGSEGGWGAHPGTSDTSKKYISLHGRTDAVVRTSRMPEGYLWQHGKQYGYANNVSDAMDTVKSRVADEDRQRAHFNPQGHAWGSPEALKDFSAKYSPKGFASGAREINSLRKRGK